MHSLRLLCVLSYTIRDNILSCCVKVEIIEPSVSVSLHDVYNYDDMTNAHCVE